LKRLVFIITNCILFTLISLTPLVSGCHPISNTIYQNQPIEIVSVSGSHQPINPGGPIVEISLKNVGLEPIISLIATLELYRSFEFIFDVTPLQPLLPDKNISNKMTLIQGTTSDNNSYDLIISGKSQSGEAFIYTKQVQIIHP